MARLVAVHDFMLHHVPEDVKLSGLSLFGPDGRFNLALDMGGRRDLGEALRDTLAEKLHAAGTGFRLTETGRRYEDTERSYTFDTETMRIVLMGMPSDATLAIFENTTTEPDPEPAADGEPDDQA